MERVGGWSLVMENGWVEPSNGEGWVEPSNREGWVEPLKRAQFCWYCRLPIVH